MRQPAFFDALAGCCTGGLAPFSTGLVGPDDPRPAVPAAALLDEAMRDGVIRRFQARFDRFDPRAVYSIWTKWHLTVVLPPVLIADILLARVLPLALDRMRFVIADDWRTAAMVVEDDGRTDTDPDPFGRFEPLVFGHVDPLFTQIAARTGLTSRVLWSNAGNAVEAILRRIESAAGPSPRLVAADRMLATPCWPDGRPNPLYDAVHYPPAADGEPARRRRVCCLQYLLPDRRFCAACPVERETAP